MSQRPGPGDEGIEDSCLLTHMPRRSERRRVDRAIDLLRLRRNDEQVYQPARKLQVTPVT